MKTQFKISLFLIFLGWFAFMFLCAWGTAQDWKIRIALWFSGFFVCFIGAIMFTDLLKNKGFWMLNDELTKEIDKTKEARERYEKAEKLYLNKVLDEAGLHKN